MEHETDGEECWCGPRVVQPCPECLDTHPDPGCWKCGGERVVPAFDPEATVQVIHNDTDDILREIAP